MQPNTITLTVDPLNNGTTEQQDYVRYEEAANRSTYIGEDHLPDARNTLAVYRTFPTKTGNFKGVAKSSAKFTQDVVVPGVDGVSQLTAPIIVEVSFSIPVGATAADVKLARQRVVALCDADSIMDALNIQLMV